MKRIRQSFEDIVDSLMPVEASWLDEHAESVIAELKKLPDGRVPTEKDLILILDRDFQVGITLLRLFLDLSKDEFTALLKDRFPDRGGVGITRYRSDPAAYIEALEKFGLFEKMEAAIIQPSHWSDVFVERLKGGRGSAIKGQQRGRGMEDFVEEILLRVFPPDKIATRCRFTGAGGTSTEKADFAIPSASDPQILIEVKAYGATGSKQTDVLGDVSRILDQKRDDTWFFLVTDGVSWKERTNDLRKLVALQNEGRIRKIYTRAMSDELEADIRSLSESFGI